MDTLASMLYIIFMASFPTLSCAINNYLFVTIRLTRTPATMVPPLDCDGPSGEDHVLLMLPASQLPGDSSSATVDSLLLLQLPAGSDLTTSDLLGGEACVVGPGRGEVAPSLSPSLLSSQACLVVEGGAGRSYSLSKVETSNALILVPPQQPSGDLERPVKKQKAVADAPTSPQGRHMRARLLGSWGSGASFLDLRPHSLDRGLLRSMLAETVHDPYSGAAPAEAGVVADAGLSIPTLALALRVSKTQVSAALASDPTLGAFQLPPRDSGRWGTLAEEAREGGLAAIVAVLTECEAYNDAFVEGTRVSRDVPVESFVREVVRRSAEEEVGGGGCLDEVVVEHCLLLCAAGRKGKEGGGREAGSSAPSAVRLDLDKIAVIIAHHLFNSQTMPWAEPRFHAEWQRRMPCIGELSQPSPDLLAGIALLRTREELPSTIAWDLSGKKAREDGSEQDNEAETAYLTYFPERRLPLDPTKRFQLLFKEKEQWMHSEIEPYIKRLAQEAELSMEEILMKQALEITVNEVKLYVKR